MHAGWWRAVTIAGGATILLAATRLPPAVYLEGPPPGHTGGFADETCRQCHFENDLNDPAGSLVLTGLPEIYEPKQLYELAVTLRRPDMGRGGFQLSARLAEDRQAGDLRPADARVQITRSDADPITYVSHSAEGTALTADGAASWRVRWTAPSERSMVVFHVAANAANDDASEFGDYIYVTDANTRAGAP